MAARFLITLAAWIIAGAGSALLSAEGSHLGQQTCAVSDQLAPFDFEHIAAVLEPVAVG